MQLRVVGYCAALATFFSIYAVPFSLAQSANSSGAAGARTASAQDGPVKGETVYVLRGGRIVPVGAVSEKSVDGAVVVVGSTARVAAQVGALAARQPDDQRGLRSADEAAIEPSASPDDATGFGSRDRRVRVPYGVGVDELRRFIHDANGGSYCNPYGGVFLPGTAAYGAGGFNGSGIVDTYEALNRVEQRQAERRFNQEDMNRRQTRLDTAHQKMAQQGLALLHDGSYQRAAVALTAAADFDQGDAGCRIHLAQARLALGHYSDAARVLRRALQLQPKLAYMDLKLSSNYANPATFDAHIDALATVLRTRDLGGEVQFLLGYMEFQRGNFDAANAAFLKGARELGRDDLTQTYLELTKPSQAGPVQHATRTNRSVGSGAKQALQTTRQP